MSELKPDYILDIRGEICPYPLLKTTKRVATMESGKILEVIATDPMAPENISAWADDHGHKILKIIKNGDIRIFIQKGQAG